MTFRVIDGGDEGAAGDACRGCGKPWDQAIVDTPSRDCDGPGSPHDWAMRVSRHGLACSGQEITRIPIPAGMASGFLAEVEAELRARALVNALRVPRRFHVHAACDRMRRFPDLLAVREGEAPDRWVRAAPFVQALEDRAERGRPLNAREFLGLVEAHGAPMPVGAP